MGRVAALLFAMSSVVCGLNINRYEVGNIRGKYEQPESIRRQYEILQSPSCVDDAGGMLSPFGGCSALISLYPCETELSSLSPLAPPGLTLGAICEVSCNTCGCKDSPLAQQLGGCPEVIGLGCNFDLHHLTSALPSGTLLRFICPAACYDCFKDVSKLTTTTQRGALVELYNAAGGDQWNRKQNWLQGDPCTADWSGVTCINGNIVALHLDSNNMIGTLPSEIFGPDMIALHTIDFSMSHLLSGTLPEMNLPVNTLRKLSLSECSFSGMLPNLTSQAGSLTDLLLGSLQLPIMLMGQSGIAKSIHKPGGFCKFTGNTLRDLLPLKSLRIVNTQGTEIGGIFPEEICQMEKLQDINFGGSFITGTLPSCLGSLTLKQLFIPANDMHGTIPAEIFTSSLLGIVLSQNPMTGTLPETLVTTSRSLIYMLIDSMSELTGTIPDDIGILSNMETLVIQANSKLSGTIPNSIGNLTQIRFLTIMESNITGTIPESIGNLSKLVLISFYRINLSGNVPEVFGKMRSATAIFLSENKQLTGTLSSIVVQLPKLERLGFENTQLSGTLPEVYSLSLTFLGFGGNNFEGTIPRGLCGAEKMQEIRLENNQFRGTIPDCLGNLPALTDLDFSYNHLHGTLPRELGNAKALEFLTFTSNNLSGAPPSTYADLPTLREFRYSKNPVGVHVNDILLVFRLLPQFTSLLCSQCKLYGEMDTTIFYDPITGSKYTLLNRLVLSGNTIHGRIPSSVEWGLRRLATLDVSNNNLRGGIPEGLTNIDLLLAHENPNLRSGQIASLPSYVRLTDTNQLVEGGYQCPVLDGVDKNMVVRLDPSYYQYDYCNCSTGYWGSPPNCKACLEFATCVGGDDMLISRGFFPSPNETSPVKLLKCYADTVSSTPCNPTDSIPWKCKVGHFDRLCSKCVTGYFERGRQCVECPPKITVIFLMLILISFAIVFLLALRFWSKERMLLDLTRIFIFYAQALAVVTSDASFLWPSSVQSSLSGPFSYALMSPSIFSCIGKLDWFDFEGTGTSIAILCCFWVVLFVLLASGMSAYIHRRQVRRDVAIRRGNSSKSFTLNTDDPESDTLRYVEEINAIFSNFDPMAEGYPKWPVKLLKSLLMLLSFMYLPITVASLRVFQCENDPVVNKEFMVFMPSVECDYSGGKYRVMWLTAVILTPLVVVGLPCLFIVTLVKLRFPAVRQNRGARHLLGFLYSPYKPDCYWYFVIAIFRRLLIAVCVSVIPQESGVGMPSLLLLFVVFFATHFSYQPLRAPILNHIETLCLVSLFIVFSCGSLFSSGGIANEEMVVVIVTLASYPVVVIFIILLADLYLKGKISSYLEKCSIDSIATLSVYINEWARDTSTEEVLVVTMEQDVARTVELKTREQLAAEARDGTYDVASSPRTRNTVEIDLDDPPVLIPPGSNSPQSQLGLSKSISQGALSKCISQNGLSKSISHSSSSPLPREGSSVRFSSDTVG